jgi:hypothetical protein
MTVSPCRGPSDPSLDCLLVGHSSYGISDLEGSSEWSLMQEKPKEKNEGIRNFVHLCYAAQDANQDTAKAQEGHS